VRRILLAALALGSLGGWVSTTAQTPPSPKSSEAELLVIRQYCGGCHNDRVKSAGVSFDNLTPEAIGQHADVFEKAVRKLRGRVMPPPNAKQPDAATVDSLVGWLEQTLDRAVAIAPSHAPQQTVVLHRLNRKEYANA